MLPFVLIANLLFMIIVIFMLLAAVILELELILLIFNPFNAVNV